MQEMTQLSIAKSGKKGKPKTVELNKTQRSDVKEKTYVTKTVDSSIAILDSSEDDIILEALLNLSKYVDHYSKDLVFSQHSTLLQKLLNLFNRNECILRLVLRLLETLLTIEDVMVEIDQDIYDDKVLKMSNMYISHSDSYVRRFCVSILSKLAGSRRISCLIFKVDLLNPILDTIQKTKDTVLLESTLELFLKLLSAPAALGILPEMYNFEISILLMHLEDTEKKIAHLSYEVIRKLTYYSLHVFQKMFREAKLVENMLEVVMNPEKQGYHKIALDIICNCLKSEETSNYFIETLEFLKFCQWVKTCSPEYLFPSIFILEQLTRIPSRRQILFDLSVEESILYCLRSTEKNILNKTCEAISNMTTHRFCCERMLTPVVLKELFSMLLRKDEEDPANEVALKTILCFSRRNVKTLEMIYTYGGHKILLTYFKKGNSFLSEASFLGILEILYKMALHQTYQQDIVDHAFFEKLLYLFQTAPINIATFVCEILTNFISCANFRHIFLTANGPQIFVGVLQTSKNLMLLKNVLLFIHGNLLYEKSMRNFLQNNLVRVLKEFSGNIKMKAPFADNILKQIYNFHLPLKLFELNRLDITDKITNKFYLINGEWKAPFPFLEILQAMQVSTIHTIYVVDYTLEIARVAKKSSTTSESAILSEKVSSESIASTNLSKEGLDILPGNYGKIPQDVFLPRYIYHIGKCFEEADKMMDKFKILAEFVDAVLSGPKAEYRADGEEETFALHIKSLKRKLGTNLIPIGYLRIGFHCERALLFKAIADRYNLPCSLVKGKSRLYWNEVALFDQIDDTLQFFVVDLMDNLGDLLSLGSRQANQYCKLEA